MQARELVDGLIMYIGLVVLLTFHEFGHAWMAWKSGDDTAKLQGRVSLNPLVHIDLIGTVILPLLMIFVPASRFLVGWAKPVPVNPGNLRNPKLDDILVTLAGPMMNLFLAVILVGFARVGLLAHVNSAAFECWRMAKLSLILFFFNLIPIPPLDGSQIVRVLIGMSYATYLQIARYGFLLLILVLQVQFIRDYLDSATAKSQVIIAGWFGFPMDF
ncbi:MAG TPA: site-2 protease family protein [Verrucomicrobiae bacterium]|nr:site-2 protease family protein [Verrucomicrobiae bacterium]